MSTSSDKDTDGTLRQDQFVYSIGVSSQRVGATIGALTGIVIFRCKPNTQRERNGQRPKEPNGYQEI